MTSHTHSWPYNTTILAGWFNSAAGNVGDSVNVYVAPNIVTGAIGAPVSINDVDITVTPTVIDNIAIGFHLNLTDGVSLADLGRVIAIDPIASVVTVENGSTSVFSPLSPTYVRQTVHLVDNLHINVSNTRYGFAEKKLGGKNLPANIDLVIEYKNITGGAKDFTYNIEYIY